MHIVHLQKLNFVRFELGSFQPTNTMNNVALENLIPAEAPFALLHELHVGASCFQRMCQHTVCMMLSSVKLAYSPLRVCVVWRARARVLSRELGHLGVLLGPEAISREVYSALHSLSLTRPIITPQQS
jgi:hypothetical protein